MALTSKSQKYHEQSYLSSKLCLVNDTKREFCAKKQERKVGEAL